jgi:CDP-diglyceride synthetase
MLEQVHNLYFLAGLLFSIILGYIILKNLGVGSLILKSSNPWKDERLLLVCWSILIVCGSIITSNILSRLKYSINVIPLLFLGITFGWFGPETTYKIVDGKNHEIKSMALPLLFSLLLLLYNVVLDMTQNLKYLTADGVILNTVVFIFILNMILSRTVLEFIKEPL